MIVYRDKEYGFIELFNDKNGTLIRSDIDGHDPIMRSYPELLDVGIMGHCTHGFFCSNAGIDCYQRGSSINNPNMTSSEFEIIAKQAKGKVFQIALGGAGDPNKHPEFEKILSICRHCKIVPNITTSGYLMSEQEVDIIQRYCGAAAVSWYSRLDNDGESNLLTISAVKKLIDSECICNIHFVVSNETLSEAIIRLERNLFPSGINAVIFILYKPVGNGLKEKLLSYDDSRLSYFFDLVAKNHPFKIGFDTCFTPAIIRWGKNVSVASIDACEAGLFSMYIDSQLNCYPCSFGIWNSSNTESLRKKTIKEIWDGEQFSAFRNKYKEKCIGCKYNTICKMGCSLGLDIDLC